MSDVQFNEPEYGVPSRPAAARESSFADWLVSMGIVHTAKQGERLLLYAAIVIFLLAGYVFFSQTGQPARQPAVLKPAATISQ